LIEERTVIVLHCVLQLYTVISLIIWTVLRGKLELVGMLV